MSANQTPQQISPTDAVRSVMVSSPKLAGVAAICTLLFLFLPVVSVSSFVMGVSSDVTISGNQMCGWTAWLAFLVFAVAALSRFMPSIVRYRQIIDIVAFGMVAVVLAYAVLASPIATAAQQVHQLQEQFGGLVGGDLGRNTGGNFGRNVAPTPPPVSFSVLPNIGVLPFVLAPLFLLLAKRRERTKGA